MSPLSALTLLVVMVSMPDDQKHREILTLKCHRRAAFRIIMLGSVVTLPCPGVAHKINDVSVLQVKSDAFTGRLQKLSYQTHKPPSFDSSHNDHLILAFSISF